MYKKQWYSLLQLQVQFTPVRDTVYYGLMVQYTTVVKGFIRLLDERGTDYVKFYIRDVMPRIYTSFSFFTIIENIARLHTNIVLLCVLVSCTFTSNTLIYLTVVLIQAKEKNH